jgi:hypothetical protein
LPGTNALAYYGKAKLTTAKKFYNVDYRDDLGRGNRNSVEVSILKGFLFFVTDVEKR